MDFADNWLRNQYLFHHQFETGLYLNQAICQLYLCKEKAIDQVQNEYAEKIKNKIKKLQTALAAASAKMEKQHVDKISSTPFQLQESDFDNTEKVYMALTESLQVIGQNTRRNGING
ncbi:MAG: hypothetical protein R2788_13620 [Saprospiraceae bacterium]